MSQHIRFSIWKFHGLCGFDEIFGFERLYASIKDCHMQISLVTQMLDPDAFAGRRIDVGIDHGLILAEMSVPMVFDEHWVL